MSQLTGLIKALIASVTSSSGLKSSKVLGEAYLCDSSDLSDLERRMRLVDIADRDNARSLISGTMMP